MSHLSLFLKGGSGGRAPPVEDCGKGRFVSEGGLHIALGIPTCIHTYIYILIYILYIYIYMLYTLGISYVVKLLVELLYCVCV